MPDTFLLHPGFSEDQRGTAAQLFWDAFAGKLGFVLRPAPRALAFLEAVLDPAFAIGASAPDGTLLGLAGFKTREGALADGSLVQLCSTYGALGGLWRALLLEGLERTVEPDGLLMDGIFVSAAARGQGIGSALLQSVFDKAAQDGLKKVRLDVVDTNPRARALYERMGFEAVSEEKTGPLRHVFGFSAVTRMEKRIGRAAEKT